MALRQPVVALLDEPGMNMWRRFFDPNFGATHCACWRLHDDRRHYVQQANESVGTPRHFRHGQRAHRLALRGNHYQLVLPTKDQALPGHWLNSKEDLDINPTTIDLTGGMPSRASWIPPGSRPSWIPASSARSSVSHVSIAKSTTTRAQRKQKEKQSPTPAVEMSSV